MKSRKLLTPGNPTNSSLTRRDRAEIRRLGSECDGETQENV